MLPRPVIRSSSSRVRMPDCPRSGRNACRCCQRVRRSASEGLRQRQTGDGPRCEHPMQRLQGIAVSPGVAIGEALVMDTEGFRIPRRFVARDAVVAELERLDKAIAAAGAEIESNRDAI